MSKLVPSGTTKTNTTTITRAETAIQEIHEAWQQDRVTYKVSVLGFKGVGKSSLVQRLLNPHESDFKNAEIPESGVDDMFRVVLQRGGRANSKFSNPDDPVTPGGPMGFGTSQHLSVTSMSDENNEQEPTALRLSSVDRQSTVLLDVYDSGVGTLDSSMEHVSTHCVICVYDLSEADSFSYLQPFPSGFLRLFKDLKPDQVPYDRKTFVLVGNKLDLVKAADIRDSSDGFSPQDQGYASSASFVGKERGVFRETAQLFCEEHNWIYYEVSAVTGEGVELLFDDIVGRIDAQMSGMSVKKRNSLASADGCCAGCILL